MLISIVTDIDYNKLENGEFRDKEIENFDNSFHQALIIPVLENAPNNLDLSTNKDFKIGGKYVDNANKINQNIPGFFEDVQKLFFEAKDTNGSLINSKFTSGYFTVFSIAAQLTNNIMAYVEIAYSTWRWQWYLINPNIPEK